ncbi:MAG: fumarylacetoacetate hydrolase family protein [archaeon GBS-70-058]|nr:fumarylacetoacetate hydrolase family protein [Candidatus Culexarchaeum nevadense]
MLLIHFTPLNRRKLSSGILVDDVIIDLNSAYQKILMDEGLSYDVAKRRSYKVIPRNIMALINRGPLIAPLLRKIIEDVDRFIGVEGVSYKLSEVRFHAPVPRPGKLIGIGLNYRSHVEETGSKIPSVPIVFTKATTSIIGPYDDIILPKVSDQVDFEGELAVVIGVKCKYVSKNEALNYVLGYMVANDVTARDLEFAGGSLHFFRSKSLDTFCPMGPGILLREYVDDWRKFRIKTLLNGILMQNSLVDDMIFGIEDLVSHLSQDMTLMPGDVILTGTPSGVGFRRNPPVFLRDGDVVEVHIEGIGSIINKVRKLNK